MKPALIVTYGGHGGTKCAAQLRQVLTVVKMRLAVTMPSLVFSRELVEANTGNIDADAEFSEYRSMVQDGLRELDALL